MNITVVITTIGRNTLDNAIKSAFGWPTVVVYDGPGARASGLGSCNLPRQEIVLGQHFGNYGCAAFNVGVAMATTEYITKLDDDDEFVPGALQWMEYQISNLEIDIWIPGLRYKNGHEVCLTEELRDGNVACPTIRTKVAVLNPIKPAVQLHYTDFEHIQEMVRSGSSIKWYKRALINVRPQIDGNAGLGV